jgi:hypothetical protein
MTYQSQANGLVAFKPQVSKGTTVSGGSGFVLRTAGGPGGKISKNLYDSNEVTQDLMHSKGRHGLRKASGSYTCELSLDNHDSFYEAFFRGTWATSLVETEATGGGATSITTTTTTIVGNTGSFITVGFRVGDVVVLTNHSTAGNNSRNLRITALTATVMTVAALDGLPLTLNAVADTTFTITRPGQKLINPAAGAAVKTSAGSAPACSPRHRARPLRPSHRRRSRRACRSRARRRCCAIPRPTSPSSRPGI